MNKHYYIAVGIGLAAGFWLANAATGTGIYSTPIGQTAANLYVAGHKAGSPTGV